MLITHTIRYRKNSASTAPTSGTARPMGSDRNRSKTPFSMSAFMFCPIAMELIASVCASSPGSRQCRYSGRGGRPRPPAPHELAAEDVVEQQQEDDRLQRHVDELLGRADDLDHVAPGEHQRVVQLPELARTPRRECDCYRGHAATSCAWGASLPDRVPVRGKTPSPT